MKVMKKQYMTPELDVVELKMDTQLLAGSLNYGGSTNNGSADAPGIDFDFDNNGWN